LGSRTTEDFRTEICWPTFLREALAWSTREWRRRAAALETARISGEENEGLLVQLVCMGGFIDEERIWKVVVVVVVVTEEEEQEQEQEEEQPQVEGKTGGGHWNGKAGNFW
jgi:hypothetical protein